MACDKQGEKNTIIIQIFERSVIYRVQKIKQREQYTSFRLRFALFCFALNRGTFLKKKAFVKFMRVQEVLGLTS